LIGESEQITQTATKTDEQILVAWFEKHSNQFYTKREIVQFKLKLSHPDQLEEQLIKLVKDGWLELEETPQTKRFKWISDSTN
jgi:hypothetical protein